MTPEERAEAFLRDYLNDAGRFANGSGFTNENVASLIREAERDAEQQMRERIINEVRELYPKINGSGWLVQDQKRLIAEEIVTAILALEPQS